jgi:hypothetical protein
VAVAELEATLQSMAFTNQIKLKRPFNGFLPGLITSLPYSLGV